MNKKQLIDELARQVGLPRSSAADFLQAFQSILYEELCCHDAFSWRGVGKFTVRRRKGYMGRNPRTGEPIEVPGREVVYFKPSRVLVQAVKNACRLRQGRSLVVSGRHKRMVDQP